MDIHAAIKQVAEACGVTTSDVEAFAQLTVTQFKKGLEGTEAIQAAHETAIKLCNRAFHSVRNYDPTRPLDYPSPFLDALYGLLTAPCGPAKQ